MQIVSGSAKRLQPRGDVHPIAKHIAISLDDVARVNADADMNLLGFVFLGVVRPQLRLNLLGALHGMDHRGKVHQEGITDGFDDVAVMCAHRLLNESDYAAPAAAACGLRPRPSGD